MGRSRKTKNSRKRKWLEEFIIKEIERYTKIHEENEKDLKYIG